MFFHQLFDSLSNTYTYLLGCAETRREILIGPARPSWERDIFSNLE